MEEKIKINQKEYNYKIGIFILGDSPNFKERSRWLFVDMGSEAIKFRTEIPSEFLNNSKDYIEFENFYISKYKSSIESDKKIDLVDDDMSSFFDDLATRGQSFMSPFYKTSLNSIEDILMYELKDFNWESVKEFIKHRLYPYMAIKEKNMAKVPNHISTREELINYLDCNKITLTFKQLESKLNSDENYELTNIDKLDLKGFFESLNSDYHLDFIRNFGKMWREKPSKDFKIIYTLLYCIFFPNYLYIELEEFKKMIGSIKAINMRDTKDSLYNRLTIYLDCNNIQKPLKLSVQEISYILKEVFNETPAINTIIAYCKEMNFKLKNIGKGGKINIDDIEHPFL